MVDRRSKTILDEAKSLVYGDRQDDYGSVRDDFHRVAGLLNVLLSGRLKAPIADEDIPLIMICLKLSRQVNKHKRDNLVDIAGYAETAARLLEYD